MPAVTLAIVPIKQTTPPSDPYELFLAAMLMMYMRAPARKTAPGEVVDLGEIGQDALRDQRLLRDTPYSICRGIRES